MELSKLTSLTFKLRVTTIDRKQTDKLIHLANEFNNNTYNRLEETSNTDDFSNFERAYRDFYIDAPQTAFCLYCLAIIHCYAMLEKNRNEILKGEFDTKDKLEKFFKKNGSSYEQIKCYETVEEFRLVNNAIKHAPLSSSKTLKTRDNKVYGLEQLKLLYAQEYKKLEIYLADLYKLSLVVGLRTE
jgi:hypothetical protein